MTKHITISLILAISLACICHAGFFFVKGGGAAAPSGDDYYVSPDGAGDESGDSESNAMAIADYETIPADSNVYWVDMNSAISDIEWSGSYVYHANSVAKYDTVGFELGAYEPVAKYCTGDIAIQWDANTTIVSTWPPCQDYGGTRIVHGGMWNPAGGGTTQGYDEGMDGLGYSGPSNILNEVDIDGTPHSITEDGSLVKMKTWLGLAGEPSGLTATMSLDAAVFTFVSTLPSDGDFRPGYCGSNKTSYLNVSDIDYDVLADLTVPASAPSLSAVTSYVDRPWIDHADRVNSRKLHAYNNCHDDGGYMAYIIADHLAPAMLSMSLDYTDAQKAPVVKGIVQMAIDFMSILEDGGDDNWQSNGGHSGGRWPVIVAAAAITSDANMAAAKDQGYEFGDIGQHFYVAASDIYDFPYDRYYDAGDYYWGHYRSASPEEEETDYTNAHSGLAEYGTAHDSAPNTDSADWKALYRETNGPGTTALALALHFIDGAVEIFDHNVYFDYHDRYYDVEVNGSTYTDWPPKTFTQDLWDSHRASYGTVYTGHVGIDTIDPAALTSVSDAIDGSEIDISFSNVDANAQCFYAIEPEDSNNYVDWSTLTTQGYDTFSGSGNTFAQSNVQDYGYLDLSGNPLGEGMGVSFRISMTISSHGGENWPLVLSNAVGSVSTLDNGDGLFFSVTKPDTDYEYGVRAELIEGGVVVDSDLYLEGSTILDPWWIYIVKDVNDFVIEIRDKIQHGRLLDTFTLSEVAGIGDITHLYFWNTYYANGSAIVNQNPNCRYYTYDHDYTKLWGTEESTTSPLTITQGVSGGVYNYWMFNQDSSSIISESVVEGDYVFP